MPGGGSNNSTQLAPHALTQAGDGEAAVASLAILDALLVGSAHLSGSPAAPAGTAAPKTLIGTGPGPPHGLPSGHASQPPLSTARLAAHADVVRARAAEVLDLAEAVPSLIPSLLERPREKCGEAGGDGGREEAAAAAAAAAHTAAAARTLLNEGPLGRTLQPAAPQAQQRPRGRSAFGLKQGSAGEAGATPGARAGGSARRGRRRSGDDGRRARGAAGGARGAS